MNDRDRGAPVPEGILLRYLDGEADAAELARVEEALGGAAVAIRLSELQAAAVAFRGALGQIAVPSTPALALPRRFRPAKAAAIALLFAAGAAAAMPSTRAALVDGLGRALGFVSGGLDAVGGEGAVPPGDVSIAVPISGPDFVVELEMEGPATPATLRIERGADPGVVVTAGTAELLVLPGGVRVRAPSGESLEATVAVPAALRRLRVRARGEDRIVDLTRTALPETLDLR